MILVKHQFCSRRKQPTTVPVLPIPSLAWNSPNSDYLHINNTGEFFGFLTISSARLTVSSLIGFQSSSNIGCTSKSDIYTIDFEIRSLYQRYGVRSCKLLNLISNIIVSNINYVFQSNCLNKREIFLWKSIWSIHSWRNAVKQFGRNHVIAIPNRSSRQHFLAQAGSLDTLFYKLLKWTTNILNDVSSVCDIALC